MKKTVLSVLAVCLVIPVLAQQPDLTDKAGPHLVRALSDAAPPARQADGTYSVWVYLADRDLDARELAAAIDAAESRLPERTLRRRAKVLAPNQRLVDARDLPVAPGFVATLTATGARLRQQSRWLNAVSVDASREQIAAIAELAFVRRLELVAKFRRPAPPVSDSERAAAAKVAATIAEQGAGFWSLDYGLSLAGLEQINVPPVHEMGVTGQGVVIGMLDSGFKTTHEALVGIPVLARHDFVNDDDVVENEPGDPATQHNHGTQTLSTVMGLRAGELVGPAFGASVILAKTEDVSQEIPIEEDYWVAGLEWVESLGADVVSSSLGYHDWYEFSDLDGNTAVTTIAADLAVGRGVVVVNSAGNERGYGFGHIIAPADGDSVIAVGAVNLSGDIAGFSSPGPSYDGRIKPDVAAQGVGNHVVSPADDQGYTSADGTSFSCPLTTGVAALVLARAPALTPMQVREALRQTADRADNPDNDAGWGILDAHAAVTYWGATIEHQPLPDTEDTGTAYTAIATITDRLPLDPARMVVSWSLDELNWSDAALTSLGADQWQAQIPAQAAGAEVSYFLEVTDSADITTRLPLVGAAAPFTFLVGPDVTPPTLAHTSLGNQPLLTWPPQVAAEVTDNLGLDRVELAFTHNGGPTAGPFLLDELDGLYVLAFPLDAADLTVGDQIVYTITAWDRAGTPNSTTSGPHDFEIIDALGVVLVIDDSGAGLRDVKYDARKAALPPAAGRSAAGVVAGWLAAVGYAVDLIAADAVTPASFDGYQAVVHSAGNNTSPLAGATVRDAVRGWVNAGGRLLIEGGEVGYDVLNTPGYADFAQDVLHAASWRGDDAGSLQTIAGQADHPLLTRPHALPATIPVAYHGYGDQDAVDPATGALVILDTTSFGGAAGILVYDDTPAPQAGQVVYLAFNLDAIDAATGSTLVQNALDYLLAHEAPPTAIISGTVVVMGGEPAGVTVATGGTNTITDSGGHYQLDDLHGGTHILTASKDGYTTVRQEVTLADGEVRNGVDFELTPVVAIHVVAAPNLNIPDNDAGGVTATITVEEPGAISEVTVDCDIQHTWIGDLTVRLTSPAGTAVILHNQTGSSAHDLVGNWPATLTVDGPGALIDFLGEEVLGDWTLFVSDTGLDDTGTLNTWGLNFLVAAPPTATDDVPLVTRLVGNRPNPFNPRTTVAFDLAHSGRVRLDLFDLRGRLVRRFVDGEMAAGRHEVVWDGRDGAGRVAAAGVYLCRLSADGVKQMHKLALIR